MSKTFRIGGVHPHDNKISAQCAIEDLPLVPRATILMNQHLGAPAQCIVSKGDKVLVGQLIAKPNGFISAPVHSPYSGTVADVGTYPDFMGNPCTAVVIDVQGDEWLPDIDRSPEIVREIKYFGPELVKVIAEKGVVGLGGASFPTNVKLSPPPGKKAECVILNGTECEPFLTTDYRIMLEKTEEIIIGGEIIRKALGTDKAYIGIEDNKPEAIRKMKEVVAAYPAWEVVVLKKRYPQGGEKQLIDAVIGRQIPSMALPIDVGAVVQNVGTALAVYEAVQKNKPLIDNIITVTSLDPSKQKNLRVRVGTPFQALLDAVGGASEDIAKYINGGPMMGKCIVHLEAPTVKATGCLLMLTQEQTLRRQEGPCIRCGKCIQACPMGLEPYLLYRLTLADRGDDLVAHQAHDCIECGCCLYTCPANLPLLDVVRLGKGKAMKIVRSKPKK